MKVLLVNGSPRPNGNTARALAEMTAVFETEGIETETLRIGSLDIRGCIACGSCMQTAHCVFDDAVNEAAPLFEAADGLVVGSPVYYASANATLVAFLRACSTARTSTRPEGGSGRGSRTSWWIDGDLRRAQQVFRHLGHAHCVWPVLEWRTRQTAGEASQDAEGMQQMRTLARNMTFLMKSIALGKDAYGLPEREQPTFTNFIR